MNSLTKLFEEKIKTCSEKCIKSNDAVIGGRLLTGTFDDHVDILFLGMAPQPGTYNHRFKREVFGLYSPTGLRVDEILNEIKSSSPGLVCWGTNCVKCNVVQDEISLAIQRCQNFLLEEIKILSPRRIVLLGKNIINNLLKQPFVAGTITNWNGIPCLHYYHPMERTGRFLKNKNMLLKFLLNKSSQNKIKNHIKEKGIKMSQTTCGASINGYELINNKDFQAKENLFKTSSVRMMVLRHLLENIKIINSQKSLHINIKGVVTSYGGYKTHGEDNVLCIGINRKYEKYLFEWCGQHYKILSGTPNSSGRKQFDLKIIPA